MQSDRVVSGTSVTGDFVRTFTRRPGKGLAVPLIVAFTVGNLMMCSLSPGLLLLHQLLNSPLVVRLLKADGVTAAASASVDFGRLAQGADQFAVNDLKLTAADTQTSLPPDARLNVKVPRGKRQYGFQSSIDLS